MFGNFKLRKHIHKKIHQKKNQFYKYIYIYIYEFIIYAFYDNTICAYTNIFFKFKKNQCN